MNEQTVDGLAALSPIPMDYSPRKIARVNKNNFITNRIHEVMQHVLVNLQAWTLFSKSLIRFQYNTLSPYLTNAAELPAYSHASYKN